MVLRCIQWPLQVYCAEEGFVCGSKMYPVAAAGILLCLPIRVSLLSSKTHNRDDTPKDLMFCYKD